MKNRYEFNPNGDLVHFIDDQERAVVPAAHIADYRQTYPDVPDPATASQSTGGGIVL